MLNQPLYHEMSKPDNAFLSRPRIANLLKAGLKLPLTTVIAGAGYGKTHAVSSLLESMRYRYAWLQLSEQDNMIAILWKRLIYAVAEHNPDLAMRLNALGYPDFPTSFYQLFRLIEVELKRKAPFVLVIDDFHAIQDEKVRYFFEKLITSNLPNLSIVLISRENPSISMAGMLSKGLMARVTEDDLRFSQDEMEAYYRLRGITLDADTASNLYAYTEGWILAIYLVGLTLKRGIVHDQDLISRAKVDIFTLIEEEIYSSASEKLKKFLISLAVLDMIPTGLLKELANDSPGILDEMRSSNLLVRYDPHSDRYQMHRLFKDYLFEKTGILQMRKS